MALLLSATVVSAQGGGYVSGPEPVSPGGTTAATLAGACPTFSWAPAQWAAAYELAVFRVTGHAQLEKAPSLRTSLPGGATTWTPPTSECLRPGAEYVWFMREVDPAGNPVGNWSTGLSFSVVEGYRAPEPTADQGPETPWGDPATPADKAQDGQALKASQPTVAQVDLVAAGAAAGGPAGPPPTNRQILDTLNQVLAILQAPEPTFSFQLCTEPAFQGELEAGSQLTLDGTIEGRVGAEGYGNGAMVRLKGAPAEKIEGKLKGGWDILKLGMCWDIGAAVRNRQAANGAVRTASATTVTASADLAANGQNLLDTVAGLDTAALQDKLQTLATKLQFNPVNSINALEGLGDFSLKSGPFAALRGDGIFSQLAQNVPLPPNVRTLLQDPSVVLNGFKEIRDQGLCNLDLPPALSGPIGEICGLIANERFSKLLDRVDTVTGTISTKVTTVTNKVQNILDQLPVSGDCKLFCGN